MEAAHRDIQNTQNFRLRDKGFKRMIMILSQDDWLFNRAAEYSILRNYQTKVPFTSRTQKFQTLHRQVSSWCLWVIRAVFWFSSWKLNSPLFIRRQSFYEIIIHTSNNLYRYTPEHRITRRHNSICLAINDCRNQCVCRDDILCPEYGSYTTCAARTLSRDSLTRSPNYPEWQRRRKFFRT
jgi:hypothetical protein